MVAEGKRDMRQIEDRKKNGENKQTREEATTSTTTLNWQNVCDIVIYSK